MRVVVQVVGCLLVGLYIVVFGRSTLRNPEAVRSRWFSNLPPKLWTLKLLRGVSILWIFLGFFVKPNGLAFLDSAQKYGGAKLLVGALAVAAVATGIVVLMTPRIKLEEK